MSQQDVPALQHTYPDIQFVCCLLVTVVDILPAASFLGGLMRMSASMCLVLMEMTGAPNTLPFLMMVLIISKGVGDRFNYRCAVRKQVITRPPL
jgi:H+/Cl- antiporter ClcA